MTEGNQPTIEPVQATYARMLGVAVVIGFVLLFAGFLLYSTGALPSTTPVEDVPELWHLSATEFAAQTARELGWGWISQIAQGDQIAFAALVYFPAATLVLILFAGLLYLRHRVTSYALISFLESVVLLVAATGLIGAGH